VGPRASMVAPNGVVWQQDPRLRVDKRTHWNILEPSGHGVATWGAPDVCLICSKQIRYEQEISRRNCRTALRHRADVFTTHAERRCCGPRSYRHAKMAGPHRSILTARFAYAQKRRDSRNSDIRVGRSVRTGAGYHRRRRAETDHSHGLECKNYCSGNGLALAIGTYLPPTPLMARDFDRQVRSRVRSVRGVCVPAQGYTRRLASCFTKGPWHKIRSGVREDRSIKLILRNTALLQTLVFLKGRAHSFFPSEYSFIFMN